MLQIYELKHPQTGESKTVYDYPYCFFDAYIKPAENQRLVSDEPLKLPVRLVCSDYLTKKPNQMAYSEPMFYDLSLQKPLKEPEPPEEIKFNRFLAKIIIQLIASNPIRTKLKREFYEFRDSIRAKPNGKLAELNVRLFNYVAKIEGTDDEDFRLFVENCFKKNVPWGYVKGIIEKYYETNETYHFMNYSELVDLFPCDVIADETELELFCDKAIQENTKSVEDYHKGKLNSINHLKGQVMKMTKGKADARVVTKILENKLAV